ncbi:ribose 5-phosphate isomerase B [bacterium (Candidatus Blackallbacteria) CG17_big_fil_post_rev_8_21_14_2_50_48_46]|uniref:Ribose 5-phosphate isomerase B n=1 Tax=bacterium (Candidatus Blackallbacteria) CG17_big_fil_post_rev_8_21_14_2_50_48_46 TaxID=2014261 RepID=A0A2M7FX95_9BACT|nr:MAG: ribose 5-phosphate isomerase B [bacterium (Candidatus Blackallbacteria) CG18_big_fil_WC_8_21_14_2_50_49_26]PIW13729.1 MAG: ribose 5-phosphate isomerase B [bacterium (Candidatus Blackallbacteria) CG17_big_fil_post_rev_8_21_14_2_50_48_46]PIW44955.1 MAG: ribose 5-phosphate isomerase B [bacterium (Candidatus Blackallbacteria) CG13_big_fil_rev_8_21_14_2_50_49_14]
MKIVLGSDHAGFELKQHLVTVLQQAGHETYDVGAFSSASVDYPDSAAQVAARLASGQAERGIVVCGSGIGISIAVNKMPGIRAALCNEPVSARLSREHNDANVLALGARLTTPMMAEEILKVWLETPFEGGRHQGRIDKITALEQAHAD